MISLSKATIDHIFEPRREIQPGVDLRQFRNRLLVDSDGRFHTIESRHEGHAVVLQWKALSRPEPEREMYYNGHYRQQSPYKARTYPAWIDQGDGNALPDNPPCKVWEVYPGPTHQGDIILAFYHIAFPNWDQIVKIESYPVLSKNTWTYIWEKFAAFDRRMHPEVMAGGAWALGAGFSADTRRGDSIVPDWKIDTTQCWVAYQDTPFYFKVNESRYGDNREYGSYRPYIEWPIEIYNDGRTMGDTLDPKFESPRPDCLEAAQAQCEQRAGCPLNWTVQPANKWGDLSWVSNVVQPQEIAA